MSWILPFALFYYARASVLIRITFSALVLCLVVVSSAMTRRPLLLAQIAKFHYVYLANWSSLTLESSGNNNMKRRGGERERER